MSEPQRRPAPPRQRYVDPDRVPGMERGVDEARERRRPLLGDGYTRHLYGESEQVIVTLIEAIADAIDRQKILNHQAATAEADYKRDYNRAIMGLHHSGEKMNADLRGAMAADMCEEQFRAWKICAANAESGKSYLRGLDGMVHGGQSISSSTRAATGTGTR